MVMFEIKSNSSDRWSGSLLESETGDIIGEEWQASSRSELIAEVIKWVPLTHLRFQDAMDPLDP